MLFTTPTIRTRTILGQRPATVPYRAFIRADCFISEGSALPTYWLIFHAPRPIHGHVEWRDGNGHGFFYAAVDPDDGSTSLWMMEYNRSMDAEIFAYISEEEAYEASRQRILGQYGPAKLEEIDLPEHRGWIVENYLRHLNP